MQPLNTRQVLFKTLPTNVTFSSAAALESDGRLSKRRARSKAREDLAQDMEHTLHGPMLCSMDILLNDGETTAKWHFVNPMSLLRKLSTLRPEYGDLLKETLQDGKAKLMFYCDETVPGNVLRPDHGRSQVCFYWTVVGLPHWARSSAWGWHHFAAFPVKLLDTVPGSQSWLFARMLDVFFGHSVLASSFPGGVFCESSSGPFTFHAREAILLADEKAIKQVWNLKGASGTKPCYDCMNVVGACKAADVHPGGSVVHYSCVDSARFQPHSRDTFRQMQQQVAADPRNRRLQQVLGISYDTHGILWDTRWSHLNPVTHNMWDWMRLALLGDNSRYAVVSLSNPQSKTVIERTI